MSVDDTEWADDTEQPEGFRLEDDGGVDWALRLIAVAETEIARVKAREKNELARIRERAASILASHEETRTRMRGFISEYLDRTDQKTVKGMCGTVTVVPGKPSIEFTNPDEFTSWALDNAPELLRYEPNKSADRWATLNVKPDGTFYDGMGDGFDVPGVRQVIGADSLRVTPAKPKADIDEKGRIA